MSNLVWRLTNNGTASSSNSPFDALPANQVVDIPEARVAVRWGSAAPFTTGSSPTLYIENQTFGIEATNTTGAIDPSQVSSSGADNVARAQLIDVVNGNTLWDSND